MDLFPLFLTIKVSFFATVLTIAVLLALFGRSGWLGQLLDSIGVEIVFTWKGAVVAAFISSLPLFVKPARAALEGVGADLENAARLLGKTEWQGIRTINLPLAGRGILR